MTLNEAIKHAEEVAEENSKSYEEWLACKNRGNVGWSKSDIEAVDKSIEQCKKCAEEHRQLVEWLKDYKRLKEQEPIDCANAEHDADGCLGYSTDRGGYSYCQTCLECPKASINNWDKEQEPCGDCISREAVMHILDEVGGDFDSPREALVPIDYIADMVSELPSVTAQPEVGRWIYDKNIDNWKCSECGETPKTMGYCGSAAFMAEHFKYCNHCGCKMQEVEE